MASGLISVPRGNVDLDTLFAAGNAGIVTGIRASNGVDIGSRYASLAGAPAGPVTGFVGIGGPIEGLFLPVGASPPPVSPPPVTPPPPVSPPPVTPPPPVSPPPPPGPAFSGTVTPNNVDTGDDGTCSYILPGPGFCVASSSWQANPLNQAGGVFYAWSFASNSGNFSFASATTGQIVKISTTSSNGTKNCTLRCVMFDGTSTIQVDTSINHVHTREF